MNSGNSRQDISITGEIGFFFSKAFEIDKMYSEERRLEVRCGRFL